MKPERPLRVRTSIPGTIWEIVNIYYSDRLGTIVFDYQEASRANSTVYTAISVDHLLTDLERGKVQWVE